MNFPLKISALFELARESPLFFLELQKSKMEELENQFKTKVAVVEDCLAFCKGDPGATLAETNLAIIEIGELRRKMDILKSVVDKLQYQTKQAEKISSYMRSRIDACEYISENLPKRLIAQPPLKASELVTKKTTNGIQAAKQKNESNNVKSEPAAVASKTSNSKIIPKIRYITLEGSY